MGWTAISFRRTIRRRWRKGSPACSTTRLSVNGWAVTAVNTFWRNTRTLLWCDDRPTGSNKSCNPTAWEQPMNPRSFLSPSSGGRCLVVGEVAQAHDGSLGMAHAYIDAIANAGADAVKFQTHIAAAESTRAE